MGSLLLLIRPIPIVSLDKVARKTVVDAPKTGFLSRSDAIPGTDKGQQMNGNRDTGPGACAPSSKTTLTQRDAEARPGLSEHGGTRWEGLPVYLVDGQAGRRQMLLELFRAWGLRPIPVDQGPAVVEQLLRVMATEPLPPVVVLDAQLPVVSGLEIVRRIRQQPRLDPVGIVLLTALERGQLAESAAESGLLVSLPRTWTACDLRVALWALLKRRDELRPEPGVLELSGRDDSGEGKSSVAARRVLLAEHSPVDRRVALRVLETLGHRVTVVSTGRMALSAVERDSFDLVLLDMQMPGMEDWETTVAIRARECRTGRRLPIIALTGRVDQRDDRLCLDLELDDYVLKPLRVDYLRRAIVRTLARQRGDLKSHRAPAP